MKKSFKKVLALTLTLTIILSACILGGVLVVSANNENVTIDRQMYNTYHISGSGANWTEQDHANNIGDLTQSLIRGKTPYYYNGTSFVPSSNNSSINTNLTRLTDGIYVTTDAGNNWCNTSFSKEYSYTYDGVDYSGTAHRMYYDLSDVSEVDSIVLIDVNGQSNSDLTLPSFKVFASETLNGHNLFNNNDLVASYTIKADEHVTETGSYITVYKIIFNEPINAKYIGFEFPQYGCYKNNPDFNATGSAGGTSFVLYELAVFGNVNVKVRTEAGTTSDTTPEGVTNLIAGQTQGGAHAGLTDGAYTSNSVGGATTVWPVKFTYQFDDNYKVDKVTVVCDAGSYGGGKLRLGEYEIYISDNKDDLYNAENLVAKVVGEISNKGTGQTVKDIIEFSKEYDTVGSFIGISIITPSMDTETYPGARICEFVVEGTRYVPDYTVETTTGSTTLIGADSLIYGEVPAQFPSVTELTDGIDVDRELTSIKKLTFDMGASATVEGVRVISRNQADANTRLGAYEIYISDSLEGLYDAANKVAEINPEATEAGWKTLVDTFTFSEHYAKTGRYIGFNVLSRTIADPDAGVRIREIEVTGTSVCDINTDGKIDDTDLGIIKKHILGLDTTTYNCDVNNDGDVNLFDLVIVDEKKQ